MTPYTNIVFIKFRLKMLRDYRFTDCLNDSQKLLFLGLLILGGATENAIPNSSTYIKRMLNLEQHESDIEYNINHIAGVFPKLIVNNGVIAWTNFEEIHNYKLARDGKGRFSAEDTPVDTDKGIPIRTPQGNGKNKKKNKKKKQEEEKEKEKKEPSKPKFSKPSIEETRVYIRSNNLNVDPGKFYDYYESNGWKIGRNPMKDWKATARNWSRKEPPKRSTARNDSEFNKQVAQWKKEQEAEGGRPGDVRKLTRGIL